MLELTGHQACVQERLCPPVLISLQYGILSRKLYKSIPSEQNLYAICLHIILGGDKPQNPERNSGFDFA